MSQQPPVPSPLTLSSIILSTDNKGDDSESEPEEEKSEAAVAEGREQETMGSRRRRARGRRKRRKQASGVGVEAEAESEAVQLQALSHDSSALLVFEGRLAGERCRRVLVDAGASSNFVSSSWVRRHKLEIEPLSRPLEVTLADGRTMGSLTGAVQVDDASVNGSSAPCRLVVMDRLSHDAILGLPWLRAAGVVLGCGPVITWNGQPLPSRQGSGIGAPAAEDCAQPQTVAAVQSEADSRAAGSCAQPQAVAAMKVGAEYEQLFAPLRQRYASVFCEDLAQIPPRSAAAAKEKVHHSIRLIDPNCRPHAARERRRSPQDVQTLMEATREMERAGLIEDSASPWSAQAVLVPKKRDGVVLDEKRPCWDYRVLNALTVPDAHPLPLPEALFDQIRGACLFSKLDLLKGFWQIPLDEQTKALLAFSTPLGLKQPRSMPFGVRNAPATFQREMQRVLRDKLYRGVMVFVDDILIYSTTAHEHAQLVEWVCLYVLTLA